MGQGHLAPHLVSEWGAVGVPGMATEAPSPPSPPPPIPPPCHAASQTELEGVRLGLAGGPEGRAPAGAPMQEGSWSAPHQD